MIYALCHLTLYAGGVEAHAFNSNTQGADFWVRGQPCLHSEFQDSQGHTETMSYLESKKTKTNQKQNKNNNKKPLSDYMLPRGGAKSFLPTQPVTLQGV